MKKHLGPSHSFVTLVLNARTGGPLHMAKGKDGDALESFFKCLTQKQKSSIRFLGVDRANAYRAAALKRLPWVKVCYDAYHLVSNMNEVADKVRRAGMAHPTEALKRRLKGKRCHLPKSKENLKEEAGEELAELPAYNEKLNTICVPKEQFRTEFCADTQNAATLQPVQWLKMAVVSRGEASGEVRPGDSG